MISDFCFLLILGWFESRVQLQKCQCLLEINIQMLNFISQREEIQAFTKTHKTVNAKQERQPPTPIKFRRLATPQLILFQNTQKPKVTPVLIFSIEKTLKQSSHNSLK